LAGVDPNDLARILAMIIQQRAQAPGRVDSSQILAANFPQPPAALFRPSSGRFGQNNAIFSNVSKVPGQGDKRLANVSAAVINVLRALEQKKLKQNLPGGGGSP
jgi:hypothetical protein